MKKSIKRRRRMLLLCPAALALAMGAPGCRSHSSGAEEPYRIQQAVRMSDPRAQMQLVSGFYGMEQGAWRWTKQRFSAILSPPAGAAQEGRTLTLRLTVPDVVISKLQSVTLSGAVNGQALPPRFPIARDPTPIRGTYRPDCWVASPRKWISVGQGNAAQPARSRRVGSVWDQSIGLNSK